MGVNFMAEKKGRRTGKMGKVAKKPSTAPMGPPIDSVPVSRRLIKSQSTAKVTTKEMRTRTEPVTSSKNRSQKITDRTIGHSAMRLRKPSGRQMLKGSIQT